MDEDGIIDSLEQSAGAAVPGPFVRDIFQQQVHGGFSLIFRASAVDIILPHHTQPHARKTYPFS